MNMIDFILSKALPANENVYFFYVYIMEGVSAKSQIIETNIFYHSISFFLKIIWV